MSAIDSLTRGIEVIDIRAPISVLVGGVTLGHIVNVMGEPGNNLGPADISTPSPIHRSTSAFTFSRFVIFEQLGQRRVSLQSILK